MRTGRVLRIGSLLYIILYVSAGCGGGSAPPPPPPTPSFSLSVSPGSLLAAQTTTSVPVTVTANPINGFTGTVNVTIGGLPNGVNSSTGSTFTLAAGGSQMVTFTVMSAVARANCPVTFSGSSGTLSSSAVVTLTVSGAPLTATTGNFKQQVIYQIVTDRFFDGDPTNNDPPQSKGLFDLNKTNFQAYWGGDFAGIQQKMAYLSGMGITAIWISPPVDNIDVSTAAAGNPPSAPYHGYWARDMKCIEEHFGDASPPCSWTAFDNMVAAAHQNGIRVIVDFAANHTNPDNAGEFGTLYDKGTLLGMVNPDPNLFFHHKPNISNFSDPYQLQYYTLLDLADLNQDNSTIDRYLEDSVLQFMSHKVDAFRLDAVKHVTWGWEYSLANTAFTSGPTFLFGEWFQGGFQGGADPLYPDSHKFANHSGISLLDFPLAFAMRDVFANNGNFSEIDNTITQENMDFASPNDLVTFVDSHDVPRLLSVNNNKNRLHEAMALLLACRGIPVILYGDEQYLHNDTNGGTDPYNRIWMSSFDISTTAYKLVDLMANLRQTNPALAYGTSQQRWINPDVYILERQFFGDVALIAVNKSETASYNITGLFTALTPDNYADYLNGLLGGFSIAVTNGTGNNDPVTAFSLAPHTVAVWQSAPAATAPQIGSIGPLLGQAGISVTIAGQGFGAAKGTVMFGSTSAAVSSWSDTTVTFAVPPGITPTKYNVQLTTNSGTAANTVPFTVLTGPLIPVTFTVTNAPATVAGEAIFLTGNVVELGANTATRDAAVGPMLAPNPPTWFVDASIPAGIPIQFLFAKIAADGTVTMEPGPPHTYVVPSSGVGSVTVNW